MQPYYQDPGKEVTIYHQDCISGMNELPEGLYDLVVTSPPYGIGKKYEENQSFGDWLRLISDFYTASYRIIKKGGYNIIVFADYYMFGGSKTRVQPMTYLHHLIAERAGWVHQCTRIWQKDFATLVDPYTISGNLPKLEYEFVATFRKPGGGREKVREQRYHPRAIWCYDEQTEVLTIDGWKKFSNLTLRDKIATLNPESWNIEYQSPNNVVSFPYNGKMFCIDTKQTELLVTPNHSLFAGFRRGKSPKLIPAEELFGRYFVLSSTGFWQGEKRDSFILSGISSHLKRTGVSIKIPMGIWLSFLGYYISEGYCISDVKEGSYVIYIAQDKNSPYWQDIYDCLISMPFHFRYDDPHRSFVIYDKRLWVYLTEQCGSHAKDKHLPCDFKQLDSEHLKMFLDKYIRGDGHTSRNCTKCVTISSRLRDDLQEIALKCGYSATWYPHWGGYEEYGYQMTIHGYNPGKYSYLSHEIVPNQQSWEYYRGMVYSCEVPNHIIYVRRNGKPVWSGNSTSGKRQTVSTLKLHPSAFPEHLVIMILNVYSDPGETVVDPFGGSGTVPFIAKKMGRKSVMFETEEEHCETSRIRCSQQVFDLDNLSKGKQADFLEAPEEF